MALRRSRKLSGFDVADYLHTLPGSRKKLPFRKKQLLYAQGSPARHVFCLVSGQVKLFVRSKQNKEAVVGLLGPGDLFGEWCVSGHLRQLANAQAVTDCTILKVDQKSILAAIHNDPTFADFMVNYLLKHNRDVQENVVDLMFNSTEKRLARALLLLARFGAAGEPLVTVPRVSQDTLAALIGSTRTQVNLLMNKFKNMGFLKYNGGMEIHNSLLNVLLKD
jgi:CRP/FNR family cyclic AMP-dependent transcriptional regulator